MMALRLMVRGTAVARIKRVEVSSHVCLYMSGEEIINGTGMGL